MIQVQNFRFKCDTALKRGRFVSVTAATNKAAYTAAAAAADAVTLADSENGYVAVQLLSDTSKMFFFEAEEAITIGDDIEVGTDGKGAVFATGEVVCVARTAASGDGSVCTGYNL